MGNVDLMYLFTSAEGRIGRLHWWAGLGILFVIFLLSDFLLGKEGLIPVLMGLLIWFAGIMLHIKRCHDRDKSGWWCLLLFIPIVGFIWAMVDLGILPGTDGANEYGPDPLETA
ncbi:MAG: DUF805 domain-containing protein [Anderseniella sp.]|jgi:uncharacterized membrane protein YhaH (DUF805 family)